MNPLLPYKDQKVAIHTPTSESSRIVNDWIMELGGRTTCIGHYVKNQCHGMENISIKENTYGSKNGYHDFKIIHFDDLNKETIFETW